ncbi:MAG: amidohydrolase family protein [Ktedonobacteraceae bacterium]|nr:amidohydrolase family protein [Ktedonobacteraceae bacterium]
MLDLNGIPVVDNHCHPMLLQQNMDALQFRSYFSEATHASFALKHVPNSVYYLWLLRQLANIYGTGRAEDAIIAARNSQDSESLLRSLIQSANIDTLILDVGHPSPDECYTPEQTSSIGRCRTAKMLRLELLMQRLIVEYADFDEVVERFSAEVEHSRKNGYCALKSIVAYRTGLRIAEWTKDQAVRAFGEARAEAVEKGQLRIAHKPLLDYLLHVAFAIAAERGLPIQFHTGYGDGDLDMRLANPLHLRDVLERPDYQTMQIILLHESYPYCQSGAYLAAIYPHVYFDLSYTIPFIDKLEMLAFTRQALSIAPASKLLYSSDGIYVPEMHWAGAIRGRKILAQVLQEMISADELDEQQAYRLAQQILHDTAYSVYGL